MVRIRKYLPRALAALVGLACVGLPMKRTPIFSFRGV